MTADFLSGTRLSVMRSMVLVNILKLSFEYVNPVDHPEHYCGGGCGEHPRARAEDVPDEHWRTVSKVGVTLGEIDLLIQQHTGLLKLIREGELVREVHLSGESVVADETGIETDVDELEKDLGVGPSLE